MTFATQLQADLDVFLNTDEFGEQITYGPTGQPSRPFTATVDRSTLQRSNRQHHTETEEVIRVFCKTSDMPNPQQGDWIQLAEDTTADRWRFEERLHNSHGGITTTWKRTRLLRGGFSKPDSL